MFMIGDVLENTIVSIETHETPNGEVKMAHYMGYGYFAADDKKPYRFVEYTFFIVPLADVLSNGGLSNYENENAEDYKQYILDCDEAELIGCYEKYDNGNAPVLISEKDITNATPDGMYIVETI